VSQCHIAQILNVPYYDSVSNISSKPNVTAQAFEYLLITMKIYLHIYMHEKSQYYLLCQSLKMGHFIIRPIGYIIMS
jgi:hypothetical protein